MNDGRKVTTYESIGHDTTFTSYEFTMVMGAPGVHDQIPKKLMTKATHHKIHYARSE